jgi:pimeloyl-ACP methyl ester carboxylesterase
MFYSVICSEDWPTITPEARRAESAETFLGEALFASRWKPCEQWPRGVLPDDYGEPVRSDKPTLILSGDLDPVTPPRWGELVLENLPNARHIVVAGAGHGVSAYGCAPRLVDEFLRSADASSLDAACLEKLKRPGFLLNPVATAQPGESR